MTRLQAALAIGTAATAVALGLSGCSPDAAAFVTAAGTRAACLTFSGWGAVMQVETVNQNNTTVDQGCKLNQGMNLAPTPPSVILVQPGKPTEVIRP